MEDSNKEPKTLKNNSGSVTGKNQKKERKNKKLQDALRKNLLRRKGSEV